MKLDLTIPTNKEMYVKAKRHFCQQEPGELEIPDSWDIFASAFGQANECELCMSGNKLESLDFNDDKAYTMFLLRWA